MRWFPEGTKSSKLKFMRRLILQMQISVDGYVSANQDWQVWNWGPDWTWDDQLKRDFNNVFESIGTILLSRKMAEEGYLGHWGGVAQAHPDDPLYAFARKVGSAEKVVVSSKLTESRWPRTRVVNGELSAAVNELKQQPGGDIICFGGAGFASALIAHGLVDEYQLFVNPAVVGSGEAIFAGASRFTRIGSVAYDCGIVVNRYAPTTASPSSVRR